MPKSLAVQHIGSDMDEKDIPENGIVSYRIIPINELDDEALQVLFEQSPDWVREHRPDWIEKNYPRHLH